MKKTLLKWSLITICYLSLLVIYESSDTFRISWAVFEGTLGLIFLIASIFLCLLILIYPIYILFKGKKEKKTFHEIMYSNEFKTPVFIIVFTVVLSLIVHLLNK